MDILTGFFMTCLALFGIALFIYYTFLLKYLHTMKQYDEQVSEQNKKTRETAFIVTLFVIVIFSISILLSIARIFGMEQQFVSILVVCAIVLIIIYYGFLIKYLSDMKEYDEQVGDVNQNTRKAAFGYTVTVIILLGSALLISLYGKIKYDGKMEFNTKQY